MSALQGLDCKGFHQILTGEFDANTEQEAFYLIAALRRLINGARI